MKTFTCFVCHREEPQIEPSINNTNTASSSGLTTEIIVSQLLPIPHDAVKFLCLATMDKYYFLKIGENLNRINYYYYN